MAFGALKGTWSFGANSIVANNQATLATGSSTVAKGDLIVVVIGEQTGNTSSGATDTLGNTYTAATVGTLGGGVSGRAFYTIVTVAGTNTNINVQATASGDNVAIIAASFEGSFSAVDKTPANNNNTDNASPFTCPATGTLSQQLEMVIAWMVDNTTNTKTATSPNTLARQQNQVVISTVVGYQTVNVTTTVSPAWTGTNPTGSQQGTISFRAADLPENQPLLALPVIWPPYHAFLRTWTFTPQLTPPTFVQPPFNQTYWPNPTQPYYLEGPQGTWVQNRISIPAADPVQARAPIYSPQFIAQALLSSTYLTPLTLATPPDQPTVLNRPRHPHFTRPWELKAFITDVPYNVALYGIRPAPFSQLSWPLPTAPYRSPQLLTWVDQTKLLLAVPFRQIDWPLGLGPRQPDRSYGAVFPRTLIGQDRLPFRQQDWPTALALTTGQTWIQTVNLALNTTPAVLPFNESDWPIPRAADRPIDILARGFNLNLIGQDRLPNRQMDWPNPKPYLRASDLATWIDRAKAYLQRPHRQTDWPVPRAPQQPIQTFTASYNRNLIGKDVVPGQRLTDRPTLDTTRVALTWINQARQAVVVVGDPFRQSDWQNPQGPAPTVRTWVQAVNLALITPPVVVSPFRQGDWPLPKGAAPQLQTWVNSSTALYIPIGEKPFNQQSWPVPPDPRRLSDWIFSTNGKLLPPTPPLPFNEYDWPLPGRYPLLMQKAAFWAGALIQPPTPAPPVPPPGRTRQHVIGSEWQQYDRMRDWPGPVGWR